MLRERRVFLSDPVSVFHFLAFLRQEFFCYPSIPVTVGRGGYFTGGLFLAPERERKRDEDRSAERKKKEKN